MTCSDLVSHTRSRAYKIGNLIEIGTVTEASADLMTEAFCGLSVCALQLGKTRATPLGWATTSRTIKDGLAMINLLKGAGGDCGLSVGGRKSVNV